jgi:hypothetical protein
MWNEPPADLPHSGESFSADEGRFGRVDRGKPVGQGWLGRTFLVAWLGLGELLPFPVFILLSLVVLTEITANSFYERRELAFVVATFCYEIAHHARQFLPTVVRILKFCAADVCAKNGEKHRNHGFLYAF